MADSIISTCPYCIQEPANYQGAWQALFQNSYPVHIEIGTGKGQFIFQLALQFPSINFIGIEKYTSVLLRAIQKLDTLGPLPNLYFICMDAEHLPNVFSNGEVDKIYLNFSDPWPKQRHAKRRLTSREFLDRYNQFLKKNGTLELKTDNRDLFEFSIKEIFAANWELISYTYDLHHDPNLNSGNIMTEYEEKFSALGNPIHKLIAANPA